MVDYRRMLRAVKPTVHAGTARRFLRAIWKNIKTLGPAARHVFLTAIGGGRTLWRRLRGGGGQRKKKSKHTLKG